MKEVIKVLLIVMLSQSVQAEQKRVDERGRELIKHFEGLKLNSYKCIAGQNTIGYGHANSKLSRITQEQADSLLSVDLELIEETLNDFDFNQSQFNAVSSFAYNVGINAFLNSTFAKTLDHTELRKWVHVKGRKISGLVERREAEIKMYCNWYDNHLHNWVERTRHEKILGINIVDCNSYVLFG